MSMKKRFLAVMSSAIMIFSASSNIFAEEYSCAVNADNELTFSFPDDFTQRIFVVDYDTNELIEFTDDKVYPISFHTGYDVEYALTDGGFAWGIMWGPTSEWDYNAQNPFVIDISDILGGFGSGNYEVVDIDLPYGYFMPEDYLETVDYDNGATDIYIKLKKTISGDVNADGEFSIADVVMLQKWLLSVSDTKLNNWKAADLNGDDTLDVFDFTLMRKALLEQSQKSFVIPDGYIAVFHGGADDLSAETYIYKTDNGAANHGFEYINVTRSSFNVDLTEKVTFISRGEVMWTDDVFTIAEENDAYDYVTIPNDEKFYTVEEFMVMFLMD